MLEDLSEYEHCIDYHSIKYYWQKRPHNVYGYHLKPEVFSSCFKADQCVFFLTFVLIAATEI